MMSGSAESEPTNPKLTNREIIFEDFRPMWSRYLNVTDRQTDRLAVAIQTALCVAYRAVKTRSQAVARIADRTAKNCICAPARHSPYKSVYQIWSP